MKNILEFTACIIEVLIAFIYFNGVLDRKENIGKLFYCFFGVAVILNISRTILLLSFSVNICITVILWLFIAILCFEGSYLKKMFFVIVDSIAIMISEILTALFLSTFLKMEYDDGFTARYLGIAISITILFVLNIFTIYIAKKKYRNLPIKYNILMILCPLASLYLLLLLDAYIVQSQNHYYFMSFLAVVGLGYINIMLFDFFDYYEKGLQAQSLDVKLNISENINISSIDLSSILYNAIDNAIEACEKVKEKYILVSITADNKALKIIIENTSLPVDIENNKIKTTKVDHRRHGYGIASIKRALKNNDGFITLNYQDGIFICRMLMKNAT